MFEKISRMAEQVVGKVSVSRRGFLGAAAKLAAGLGAVTAGVIAFPTEAQAYRCPSGTRPTLICWNREGQWTYVDPAVSKKCPKDYPIKGGITCL